MEIVPATDVNLCYNQTGKGFGKRITEGLGDSGGVMARKNGTLSDSGIRQSTLSYLKGIKDDIDDLEKKVNKIEISFTRLSGQLDIILPNVITKPVVDSLIARHGEECTKKMPFRPSVYQTKKTDHRIPVLQINLRPQTIAKIATVIIALCGAIWGFLQAFM